MDLKKYINTFQGLKLEAHFTRLVILALLVILGFCVLTIAQRPQIVTIRPWTLNEDAQITRQSASKSYLESWGFALAQLLGKGVGGGIGQDRLRLHPGERQYAVGQRRKALALAADDGQVLPPLLGGGRGITVFKRLLFHPFPPVLPLRSARTHARLPRRRERLSAAAARGSIRPLRWRR